MSGRSRDVEDYELLEFEKEIRREVDQVYAAREEAMKSPSAPDTLQWKHDLPRFLNG